MNYKNWLSSGFNTKNILFFFRKDEAANRPKVDFIPKSLHDLNIEGVTADGLNGTNKYNNLLNHSHIHSSSNMSGSGYQFKRPAPKTVPIKQTTYTPDPFDPWSFPPQGIFYFFYFISFY